MFRYLFLALSLYKTQASNVLVIGGVLGSHFYTAAEIAKILKEFGHNVTLLSIWDDPRVDFKSDPDFHYISVTDNHTYSSEQLAAVQGTAEEAFAAFSKDMMVEMIKQSGKSKENFDMFNRIAVPYFSGDQFSLLLKDGKFELIVIEDTLGYASALSLVHKDIPIIGLMSMADVSGARSRSALPQLLNSEPNFVNEIVGDEPPSLYSRWEAIVRNFRILSSVVTLFQEVYYEDMQKTGKELTDYLVGFYDIIFVMDHPAFSFPYLSPPNTFFLGAYHLEDYRVSPLPDIYQEFLANCRHKHVVLMSFGTYLEDITKFTKTMELLDALRDTKLCIILKSGLNLGSQFNLPSNQVLEELWVPQKSILHSGKINFFISHCGNNGRLESIYYNVPMLCIPLFGDQYHNARLVSRNNFGLYITRENLNKSTFISAVEAMINNELAFKHSLKNAMDIARNDPGAGRSVLKFYSDLLIKYGSADFLHNKIIMKQWYYEVMNLDIAVLLLLVVSSLALLLMLSLYKCVKCLFNKANKMKSE